MRKHEAAYVLPSNPPSPSVKTHTICYSFTSLGPLEKASLTPQDLKASRSSSRASRACSACSASPVTCSSQTQRRHQHHDHWVISPKSSRSSLSPSTLRTRKSPHDPVTPHDEPPPTLRLEFPAYRCEFKQTTPPGNPVTASYSRRRSVPGLHSTLPRMRTVLLAFKFHLKIVSHRSFKYTLAISVTLTPPFDMHIIGDTVHALLSSLIEC
ncbi:hypothetical protein BDN70DRAFT_934319 [Pholiota conissans]|uniref:Uncharacterized protein n=1 Tax=Pholiota conissans TaxID=109636 RepID=A0A9P5YZD1_9AGAR|nr:hypothetical protein BDN70DRAFT_934319 [Pholiota conissans]